MDKNKLIAAGIGIAFIIAATALFGGAGLRVSAFLAVSTAAAAAILTRLGFEQDYAIGLGIPASMAFHSSLAFGIGQLFGLAAGLAVSLALLLAAAIGLAFWPKRG